MLEIIKDNIEEIKRVCIKMQLESLYLFGSATSVRRFNQKSELDFLYRFKTDKHGLTLSKYDYFDLMFDLERITGKKVDLVAEEKIKNKFFLSKVNEEKIKIYES